MQKNNKLKNNGVTLFFYIAALPFFYSCKKLDLKRELAVSSDSVTVSGTKVIAAGTVIDLGENGVTGHGHCWSATPNPTIDSNKTSLGSATNTGAYSSEIDNLTSGTWHIRAYITDGSEVRYGDDASITVSFFACGAIFVDSRDGKSYKTVLIGTQCWMAENLNYGTQISSGSPGDDQTDNSTTEKYCYDNTGLECDGGGGLYQWGEAMQYGASGSRGICPDGWHIPTDDEWRTLEKSLGMTQVTADSTGWRGPDLFSQLVSGGSSGFNLGPAGYRKSDGSFEGNPSYVYFWTSDENGTQAWCRGFADSLVTAYRNTVSKQYGFCVRCVKD